jgi:sec-independent protein translocase protein TatB
VFLFIFENIGTQELILIGIVALIFLGPRKMPEYARKIGKLMSDFRSTTNEFKETWQREVNFEEEFKAFRVDDDEIKPAAPIFPVTEPPKTDDIAPPAIKEIDTASFNNESLPPNADALDPKPAAGKAEPEYDPNDKRNWL